MEMDAGEAVHCHNRGVLVDISTFFVAFSFFLKTQKPQICCFLKNGDLVQGLCILNGKRIEAQSSATHWHLDIE